LNARFDIAKGAKQLRVRWVRDCRFPFHRVAFDKAADNPVAIHSAELWAAMPNLRGIHDQKSHRTPSFCASGVGIKEERPGAGAPRASIMSTLIVVLLVVLVAAAIVLIAVRTGLLIALALLLARLLAGLGLILLARILVVLVVLIAIVLVGHGRFPHGVV
jgi:hypothetical protein